VDIIFEFVTSAALIPVPENYLTLTLTLTTIVGKPWPQTNGYGCSNCVCVCVSLPTGSVYHVRRVGMELQSDGSGGGGGALQTLLNFVFYIV